MKFAPLGADEVARRASMLAEDIRLNRFATFSMATRACHYYDGGGRIVSRPLAEYFFGDTGFGVNKAVNPFDDAPTWFGGPGLDCGHLHFFSKVSGIGHAVIPHIWLTSKRLRGNLRNPTQHNDTLEEVWWLGRWKNMKPGGVRAEVKLMPDLAGDVDWQLDLSKGTTVNLEVKRLKFDAVRIREGREFLPHRFVQFCETHVLPKFRPCGDREVNVLALTIIGDVTDEVNEVISRWLLGDKAGRCDSRNGPPSTRRRSILPSLRK